MNVTIESAIKLDESQKKEIEAVLSKKNSGAAFEYVVTPKILGGLRVTIGGKRIDLSLTGRLSQVQNSLK